MNLRSGCRAGAVIDILDDLQIISPALALGGEPMKAKIEAAAPTATLDAPARLERMGVTAQFMSATYCLSPR